MPMIQVDPGLYKAFQRVCRPDSMIDLHVMFDLAMPVIEVDEDVYACLQHHRRAGEPTYATVRRLLEERVQAGRVQGEGRPFGGRGG